MEDPRWLRLITIGLVLSALAVGYFLLTGKFTSTKTSKPSSAPQASQQAQITQASPSPSVLGLANRQSTPSAVATLPQTGFPAALIGVFSVSALVAGFGLRKYPN